MKKELLKNYDYEIVNNFRNYLYESQNAKNTILNYCAVVKSFICYFGEEDVEKITKTIVINFIEMLKEKDIGGHRYAITSINNKIMALNKFFTFIKKENLKIKTMKTSKKRFINENEILTNEDIDKMLKKAFKKNKRTYCLIRILLQTGIRISELKFVTKESLDKKFIYILNKGKERKVPLAEDLIEDLKKYCEEEKIDKGFIIKTKNNKPIDRTAAGRDIKKIAQLVNVESKKAYPHNLRHLFSINFLKNNKNSSISILADILGHESIITTSIYLRDTMENVRKQMSMESLGIKNAS